MSNAPVPGAPAVVRAHKNETLHSVAARVLKDARAAELLAAANPGLGEQLPEGTPVRLPDSATLQRWAQRKGISLGFDPTKGAGTRQKRAWSRFQVGPSAVARAAQKPRVTQANAVLAAVVVGKAGVNGPGVLVPSALGDATALCEALTQRMMWLGLDSVFAAARDTTRTQLEQHAAQAAAELGRPAAADEVVLATLDVLAQLLAQDVAKEARRLLGRAQQALAASAQDTTRGMALLASLREAEPAARIRLLTALSVPRAMATAASDRLQHMGAVRAAVLQAAASPPAARASLLVSVGVPAPLHARLTPGMTPASADALALEAMGLVDVAVRAHQGAVAMHQLVTVAAPRARGEMDPASAFTAFPAARAVVFAARGAANPDDTDPAHTVNLVDECVVHALQIEPAAVHEQLRVAWRAVEALGPQLAIVDASALGRGVGVLLARIASSAPAVETSPREPSPSSSSVRTLRASDLVSMGGAAAVRAQESTDALRTMVPLMGVMSACEHFPFATTSAPPAARLEYRRRVADGVRTRFSAGASQHAGTMDAAWLKSTVAALVNHASLAADVYPDMPSRLLRLKPLLDRGDFASALARAVEGQRYLFRRDTLSRDAVALVAAAWLVDHARTLPPADACAAEIHRLCTTDGGKLLDAVERWLLARLA